MLNTDFKSTWLFQHRSSNIGASPSALNDSYEELAIEDTTSS